MIFLIFKYEPYFQKSNNLLKGLALSHVLTACYLMSIGAGACLNPALGMSQTTYMYGFKGTAVDCIWIYMGAPFVGAALAAVAYMGHRGVSTENDTDKSVKSEGSEAADN